VRDDLAIGLIGRASMAIKGRLGAECGLRALWAIQRHHEAAVVLIVAV
jgi:hypothetical protein